MTDSVDVNLAALDLNLVVALDALLTERSVTGAARVLHRSQPALSASLKRLRHLFGDELLLRVGNRHVLTPLATQLKPRVATAATDLERLFATRGHFDPASSAHEFTVYTSDYGQVMLGRAIADLLAIESPGVRLRLLPLSDRMISDAEDALRSADGFILPHGFIEGLPHTDAYEDQWSLLVDGDHAMVGDPVRLDDLEELEWVLPYHGHERSGIPPVRQLQLLGIELDVVVACEGFLPLPSFVAGTARATVIQRRLAERIAPGPAFRTIPCPFDAVPLVEALWWHPSLELNPPHQWFRSIVERAGQHLATPASPT